MKKFQPKTRGGNSYELMQWGLRNSRFPIQGKILSSDGTWMLCSWTESGSYTEEGVDEWDLIPVEEPDATQPPSYDLTKVSERFRALEDGYSLRDLDDSVYTQDDLWKGIFSRKRFFALDTNEFYLISKPVPKVKYKKTMWGCEAELRSLLAGDRKYITLTNEAADAGRIDCTPVEVEWSSEE